MSDFFTANALYSGDHVSWHAPLDNGVSRLQHMLMTDDPQLPPLSTDFGTINFVQVTNFCSKEFVCVSGAKTWQNKASWKTLHLPLCYIVTTADVGD